jgi:hypothetical protein
MNNLTRRSYSTSYAGFGVIGLGFVWKGRLKKDLDVLGSEWMLCWVGWCLKVELVWCELESSLSYRWVAPSSRSSCCLAATSSSVLKSLDL